MGYTRRTVTTRLELLNERLDLYLKKEADILSGGVQAYGIGSRNLSRYNADLATVREAISELEDEIAELEAVADGSSRRKSVGVVLRDW